MSDEMNNFKSTDDTEEIILDMEEFEMLLASNHPVTEYEEFEESTDDFEENLEDFEVEYDDFQAETVQIDTTSKKTASDVELEEVYDEDEEVEIAHFFKDGIADKMIYLVGALIILFGIIVGVVAITGRTREEVSVPNMEDIGMQVADLGVIGEEGITAVFGKRAEDLTSLFEAEEEIGYNEIDEETGLVNVSVSLTSILKDLKIKFINKNNKLVANVPFVAEVKDKDGKTETYTDEDKDGIIYISGLSGGNYNVKMQALEAYSSLYSFDTNESSILVKNEIAYEKVDVSNEIKSDANTDTKNEDTRKQETETESKLQDTVEFVVSTRTPVNGESGYEEISASKIPDPKKIYTSKDVAKTTGFRKLDTSGNDNPQENKIDGFSGNPSTMNPGESASVSIKCTGQVTGASWSSSNDSVIAINGNNLEATLKAGDVDKDTKVTVSCEVSFLDGTTKSASFDVTVRSTDASSFSYSVDVPTMTPGTTFDLSKSATVVVKDKTGNTITSGYTLSYESSKSSVVSVDGSVLTAKKKGSATITVTCTLSGGKTLTASFGVSVGESSLTVKINYSKKTIFLGGKDSVSLKATVAGFKTSEAVTWESSNEGVVKVGKDGSLTAVSEGSATIVCKSVEAPSVKAECAVTVVVSPEKNEVSLLTDADGHQVYVYDSSSKKYKEAKYADYYKDGKLYIQVAVTYKYTGWWTLSGKTYFFDKNGNKVTGEQVILGTKYVFGSDGALTSGGGTFGIDVSKWNGTIDWAQVAKSGVSYAIIRSGFRGSTAGGLYEDSKFASNMKNATANGIKVGVYFFTQATTEVEAVEEASMVLGQIAPYKVTYPIFIDVESAGAGARAENLSNDQRTKVIKAFCKTISNGGYTAGVYANKTWFTMKINTSELTSYKIWLAQYNSSVTYSASRYDLWQYSDAGSIGGISGPVDLDKSYLGY